MSTEICFVCGVSSMNCQNNFAQIKTKHSGFPITIFIKKFVRKLILSRNITDPDNFICQSCLVRINEYDEICVKAKHIEDTLHKMIRTSERVWRNAQLLAKETESQMPFGEPIQDGNDDSVIDTFAEDIQIDLTEKQDMKEDIESSESEVNVSQYEHPTLYDRFLHSTHFPFIFPSTFRANVHVSTQPSTQNRHECLECGERFRYKVDHIVSAITNNNKFNVSSKKP